MSLLATLIAARKLVLGGWTGPHCFDAGGVVCACDAEGIVSFCVDGAIEASADTPADRADAWLLLEAVACQNSAALDKATVEEAPHIAQAALDEHGFQEWLERPGRNPSDLSTLFDVAITRAKNRGAA